MIKFKYKEYLDKRRCYLMKRGLIVLIVIVIFLAGCDTLRRGEEKPDTGTSFIGGSDGVDISFADGEPPEGVLDAGEEVFRITLLLKNLGEYTINSGRIIASLEGINKENFGLKSLTVVSTEDLERARKDREEIITGGSTEIFFGEASYKPDLPADFSTNIRANVCYDYGTGAVASLCLKKDVLKREEGSVCEIDAQGGLSVENSGGPLQISGVRERPSGSNKVSITFDVENKGSGLVYEPGTFSNLCSGQDIKEDKVKVKVRSPASNINFRCSSLGDSSEGIIRLVQGIKTVSCNVDTSNLQETSFREPLIIDLEYMYKEAVSVPITVENAQF